MDSSSDESSTTIVENYNDSGDDTDSELIVEANLYNIEDGKTWKTIKYNDIIIYSKYIFLNNKTKTAKWQDVYPNGKVNILRHIMSYEWFQFFDSLYTTGIIDDINEKLSETLNKKDNKNILPHPELLFAPLNILAPKNIKVIIMGQDPYFTISNEIPLARGFSFAVPRNCELPPSLKNILNNMIKFKHRDNMDVDIAEYSLQGCFFINSSFTTIEGTANSHSEIWKKFTIALLKEIVAKNDKLVFVCWGSNAHYICKEVIDIDKHKVITTSHPSPHSYMSVLNGTEYKSTKKKKENSVIYPAFDKVDHFGLINTYLKELKRSKILWNI